ncbi:glycosyltransferase family 9 protein [Pedobacter arcticus]|uniref:glycosyltransferase family 9 protein n=1 Tax=Pedobacter arcticus TaxID=752140 RepID=UPI0004746F79|nr:glycosyltransferase family 9 protein [Pedobacter arcticus]
MDKRRKVLIIRFSAMGDVAMTAPIVKQIAEQNIDIEFVYLSRPLFEPFFANIPNLTFYPFNPKLYKGLGGLFRLYWQLKKLHVTEVADLHFNLRSRIISFFFKANGLKVAHLDKGRAEKKDLTAKHNKVLKQLKPMWLRYLEVFEHLGMKTSLVNGLSKAKSESISEIVEALTGKKGVENWVGVSPFAQHLQKVYPIDKMEEVVRFLDGQNIRTFIFGGGTDEKTIGERWQTSYPNCVSVIGEIKLKEELNLIAQLDVMISMDSAGMHLASLKNTEVVSVWGATHPFAGFLGFGQRESNCVQADISCRPCSVYGNKPCFRGDIACMQLIDPKHIIDKTLQILKKR